MTVVRPHIFVWSSIVRPSVCAISCSVCPAFRPVQDGLMFRFYSIMEYFGKCPVPPLCRRPAVSPGGLRLRVILTFVRACSGACVPWSFVPSTGWSRASVKSSYLSFFRDDSVISSIVSCDPRVLRMLLRCAGDFYRRFYMLPTVIKVKVR